MLVCGDIVLVAEWNRGWTTKRCKVTEASGSDYFQVEHSSRLSTTFEAPKQWLSTTFEAPKQWLSYAEEGLAWARLEDEGMFRTTLALTR